MDQLRIFVDCSRDGSQIKIAVVKQIHLTVFDAVFHQRALAFTKPNDLLQRVIGLTGHGQQLVTGKKIGAQRHGEGVRAAGDLRTHQRSLGVEAVGIDALQIITPEVVVSITGCGGEVRGIDAVFVHGGEHLGLVNLGVGIDPGKAIVQRGEHLLAETQHSRADAQRLIDFRCSHDHSSVTRRYAVFFYTDRAPLRTGPNGPPDQFFII